MDANLSDLDDMSDSCYGEGERCEPLGAPKEHLTDEVLSVEFDKMETREIARLYALEEEQEVLSSSLFSLTSHLAQVQFRLRQIMEAPVEQKETMLKSLEEFTFHGVPEMGSFVSSCTSTDNPVSSNNSCPDCHQLDEKMKEQRSKQIQFIEQLKTQLKQLEKFTNDAQIKVEQNQRNVLINDLRHEIDRNLRDNWRQPLTAEELRHQVNCTVRQLVNPQMSREEIVDKLQKQVDDMQRFIGFLQVEACKPQPRLTPPKTTHDKKKFAPNSNSKSDELRTETINLMRKVVALLQMFAVAQFGCSTNTPKDHLKKSNIVNHWGDLRARLEMSIDAVLNLIKHAKHSSFGTYDSDSDDNTVVLYNTPLTTAVRKHLAMNIRDLMQHGLVPSGEAGSLMPFIGCFPMRKSTHHPEMHAWELILKYYEVSNGESFNSTPARKLSQSFNLDIVGTTTISNKQSMLSTIGAIIASHAPYKRSYDSHFKAFVCAAVNSNKLVAWLNLLYKNKALVQLFYTHISYVHNTGFQDSLQSLDRLTPHKFDLPVDLAVKQFQNIKDVFM